MLQSPARRTPTQAGRATGIAVAGSAQREYLTTREREVARLLIDGWTDRQIAAGLIISRKTASNHVASILAKLGVETRTAAATYLIRGGLV